MPDASPVSVRIFGALGTGKDDAAAIEIAAAYAAFHNRPLYIPAGTYQYVPSRPLVLDVPIFGDGAQQSVIAVDMRRYGGAVFLLRHIDLSGLAMVERTGSQRGIGLHVSNVDEGRFVGPGRVRGARVAGFQENLRINNVFQLSVSESTFERGGEGIVVAPLKRPGQDGGYVTNLAFRDCIIQFNDRNVCCRSEQVARFIIFENTIVQGPMGQQESILLENVDFSATALYLEGGAPLPAIRAVNSTLIIRQMYMNNTGGIDLGAGPNQLTASRVSTTSSRDGVSARGSGGQSVVIEDSHIKSWNVSCGHQYIRNSHMPGGYVSLSRVG